MAELSSEILNVATLAPSRARLSSKGSPDTLSSSSPPCLGVIVEEKSGRSGKEFSLELSSSLSSSVSDGSRQYPMLFCVLGEKAYRSDGERLVVSSTGVAWGGWKTKYIRLGRVTCHITYLIICVV